MDNLDTLLFYALFMAFVGALPTEDERKAMTFGDFVYAVFTRFLHNASMNIGAVNSRLGMFSKDSSVIKDSTGTVASRVIETSVQEKSK